GGEGGAGGAGMVEGVGGLGGVWEMAAGLGLVSIAAVYGFARRLFSNAVGLGAALVLALLAPAVLVSRIATRDSGAICFFALGVWMFTRAWQNNRKRDWALAGLLLFAAFLCKYLVAIYFPALVVLALWKRKTAPVVFVLSLSAFCALYAGFYRHDLMRLLQYGGAYGSLGAPQLEIWKIYFWERWDFWLLAATALPATFIRGYRAPLCWAGVIGILLFQLKSRADYDYWKHVNYALIFVVPLAVAGVMRLGAWLGKSDFARTVWGACAAALLAAAVGWLGKVQNLDRFTFWPDVDPILAYFENRLTANDRILVDDTVLRYYFSPPLHQYQITDPMYFHYGQDSGDQAYKSAIQEGTFDYVVLDGGIGAEAREMDAAIHPLPELYRLEFVALEPTLGQRIEIYGKPSAKSTADPRPNISLLSPASNSVITTNNGIVVADGIAYGAEPDWYAEVQVFTNRWYRQGGHIPIAADGTFHQQVALGGAGRQQCNHLLRVRLYDSKGNVRASALSYGVTRANLDGTLPTCR